MAMMLTMLSITSLAFDIHNGTDARAINDLANLNNQIDNSIVTRDIVAVDDTAHTVSLTQAGVDRLGELGPN